MYDRAEVIHNKTVHFPLLSECLGSSRGKELRGDKEEGGKEEERGKKKRGKREKRKREGGKEREEGERGKHSSHFDSKS